MRAMGRRLLWVAAACALALAAAERTMSPEELARAKRHIDQRRKAELRAKADLAERTERAAAAAGAQPPRMVPEEEVVDDDAGDEETAWDMGGSTASNMKLDPEQLEAARVKVEAALRERLGPDVFAQQARDSVARALSRKFDKATAAERAAAAVENIMQNVKKTAEDPPAAEL